MVKNISFLFIILLFCGCASSKTKIIADSLDEAIVITGSMADAAACEKGGTLLLGSFKPGPGAVAGDETDQLSGMIIKGIKEARPWGRTTFTIVPQGHQAPDLFLEGYIDDFGRMGDVAHFSVSGEIWLRETGEKVLLFQTSTVIHLKTQDPKTVAYQIGVAIAHFIESHNVNG